MTDWKNLTGTTISHYRVGERLGQGGMGIVYRGEDLVLRRPVAIKFLLHDEVFSDVSKLRFLREARNAASLNHPGICSVFELEEIDGTVFIVMEYLQGRTLRKWMEQTGSLLDPPQLLALLSAVGSAAEGLEAAHQAGIVHRDVKPENIMILSDGRTKIMDFGLARLSGETQLTRAGTAVGTLAYMSPEQARGANVDHRTDIWSLGVVLYESMTGAFPFRADHPAAMLYKIVTEEPVPFNPPATGQMADLEPIVMRCLQKDPSMRYQSASRLAADIRQHLRELERSGERHDAVAALRPTTGSGVRKILRWGIPSVIAAVAVTGLLLWKPWVTSPKPVSELQAGITQSPLPPRSGDVKPETLREARASPPKPAHPLEAAEAGSAEELAGLIAQSLCKAQHGRPEAVIVEPFTYRDTHIGGSFSSYFRSLLENRLFKETNWRIVKPPTNLDSSFATHNLAPGVPMDQIYLVTGTYWDLKRGVKFVADLRGGGDGGLLASAEATASSEVFRGAAFPLKPANFERALEDHKLQSEIGSDDPGLRLDAWTNKGKENLIFGGILIASGILAKFIVSNKIKIKGKRRLVVINKTF